MAHDVCPTRLLARRTSRLVGSHTMGQTAPYSVRGNYRINSILW